MNWKIFTSSCFILLSPVQSFFHNVSFFDNPNIFVGHIDNNLSELETFKTSRQFFNPRRVQKLNDEFIPTHYKIELQVILDKDKVGEKVGTQNGAPGKVNIAGINQKNSSRIVLNAGRLKVNGSSIQVFSNGQKLPLKECRHKAKVSLYEIELVNEIGAGEKVEIYMEYFAVLNSHLVGIRIKDYTDVSSGSMEKIAFTNLQTLRAQDTGLDSTAHRPSFCYNVFPCFDEPHLKATYELTITRKANQIALGSGELLSSASE
ncbi:unnamed protein product [Orchesella dallaii]|uniref:Aminopeptidase N-like N-terminal domain-containing protein n=1 Tax=Orchesella dallaii TaxID=48710 RepID=A0ABP1S9M2_9HEXA